MKLSFVLLSKHVTEAHLHAVAAAVTVQLQRDVGPAWRLAPPQVDTHVYRTFEAAPKDSLPIVLLEDSDTAGALGYHDEGPDGRPYARVFTGGLSQDEISVTVSHEAAEAYVDPLCNAYDRGADGRRYAREVCDAVEDQSYKVSGVAVSNFILPAWSDPTARHGDKVDHLGLLPGPLAYSKGGYVIVEAPSGEDTTEPPMRASRKVFTPASRTARRVRPRR